MSECKSWLGHKFVARFDTTPIVYESERHSAGIVYSDTAPQKTYIHDICVRCGEIKHRPESSNQKKGG